MVRWNHFGELLNTKDITYYTFEELQADIDDYINFYNNEHSQTRLNGLSPMEFRMKAV
ncbi:MAG: IS3 family transposase [Bacillota bacterium]